MIRARRRLAQDSTTAEALRDEVGFADAQKEIELSVLPIANIAATISFASPSEFAETFHRWSGMTPMQWRRQTRPA